MAAARALGDKERRLIARIYQEDETQPAKEVLAKLHDALGRTDWPKLSVIQRELHQIKDEKRKNRDRHTLWSIGSLAKSPVPPEALPRIFGVTKMLRRELPGEYGTEHTIDVEQAKWIARLYPLIPDEKMLFVVATVYWQFEMACLLARVEPDTNDMDAALQDGDFQLFRQWFKPDSPIQKFFKDGAK